MARTSPILIVLLLVFTFPLWIGLAGGVFGLFMGLIGAMIGLVAGLFGGMMGMIGGIFHGIFHWHWGFPFGTVMTGILVIALVVALSKRKR